MAPQQTTRATKQRRSTVPLALLGAGVLAASPVLAQEETRAPVSETPSGGVPASPSGPEAQPAPSASAGDVALPEADTQQSPPADTSPPNAETEPPSADEAKPKYETKVTARRAYAAASSSTTRERDLRLQVVRRPADVLQVVPGLFTVQHAGGGKANQYYLRGFDADHGTDLALFVDGVPVNLVSHGHGQGYADLNWLIPELVERVEVHKGTWFAPYGDFATSGAVNLVTRRDFESNQVTLGAGAFDTLRGLLVLAPEVEGWSPFVAAQVYATNGPFKNPEGLERYNLFARVTRSLSERASLSLALTSYASGWNASGQIPERAVRDGRLSTFDAVNPDEGGSSDRHSLQAIFTTRSQRGDALDVMVYLARYRMRLFSDFTFFSRDPELGDMLEQADARTQLGLDARYRLERRWGPLPVELQFGAQLRNDQVTNGAWYSARRERLAPVIEADVQEASTGLWAQADTQWTPWLRTVAGLRVDHFGFDVKDKLEELDTLDTRTSGVSNATRVSPKAALVLSPLSSTELYLDYGYGFHSNDARGVVRGSAAVTPLTRARGGEVGARVRPFEGVEVAASLFQLDLDSELVWVGDDGTTEPRGPTRRRGLEVEARARLLPWLQADADMTLTRATYVQNAGNADAVALAPTLMLSGGVSAVHPSGIFGRLGAVHIGDRPATEDGSLVAEGFTRVDASIGYRRRWYEVSLSVQNLLDTRWREAQFANVSRLREETGPESCPNGTRAQQSDAGAFEGCEDLQFTPGAPLNAQATVTLYFQ